MALPFRHNGDMAWRRAMEQRQHQHHVDIQNLLKIAQALMGQSRGTTGDIIDETPTGGISVPTYTAGCGLDLTGYEFSVDAADLVGDGLVAGDDCTIDVNPGCGLTTSAGAVVVERDDLMGDGLEAGAGGCLIDVKPYCGITVDSNGVGVNRTDLLGPGLKAGATGCLIAVDFTCGLELDGNAIRVKASDLAAATGGLTTSGTCGLAINVGCGLFLDDGFLHVDVRDVIDGTTITASLVGGCYVAEVGDICPKIVDCIENDDDVKAALDQQTEDFLDSEDGTALFDSKVGDFLASDAGAAAFAALVAENCAIISACVEADCNLSCCSEGTATYTWNGSIWVVSPTCNPMIPSCQALDPPAGAGTFVGQTHISPCGVP